MKFIKVSDPNVVKQCPVATPEMIYNYVASTGFATSFPPAKNNNKEAAMPHTPRTESQEQRDYFLHRVDSIYRDRVNEMKQTFGLEDMDRPRTPKELVKRIQDGKFTYHPETEDLDSYCPLDYIRWRDPNSVRNVDGYTEAKKTLKAQAEQTNDALMAAFPDQMLEIVNGFKNWKQ